MGPSRDAGRAGKTDDPPPPEGTAQPPLPGAAQAPGRPPEADKPATGESDSDAVLVTAAKRGSREAFQELFTKYFRLVTVMIYQKIPRASEVEDIAQETFLRAWRGLPDLRKPQRFLPWLLKIARRLVADWHRAAARDRATTGHNLDSVARHDDPGGHLAVTEERVRLLEALERLPDRYRLVLTLRFLEGLTPRGIAERLGEPSGTIRNRIFRGLAKLSKLIDEEGADGR